MERNQVQLVGRQDELAAIDRALAAIEGDRPRLIQLAGEPGIGKSCILHETVRRAAKHGYLALSGRAAEFERDLPFDLFVDALDHYVSGEGLRHLEGMDPDRFRELGAVLPGITAHSQEVGPSLQIERYRAHRAVRELLERAAADVPLVLALDDLQWADSSSQELLLHLLRRLPEAALLIAIAFRPRHLPPPVTSALDAAFREGRSDRLELSPLSPEDAEALMPPGLDRAARRSLYLESGGNPFYLEQIVRAMHGPGGEGPPVESAPGEFVPSPVAAAIAQEMEQVSEAGSAMLSAAAVVGDPFDPELAARTAGIPAADALTVLDELIDRDVVRPTTEARRFRFRHPIVRRAVYESSGAGWRLNAHRLAAEALRKRGASASSIAHHVERSAQVGDEHAIMLLTQAGHSTAPRSPATAARWFEAALRLLPEGERSIERQVELLAPLAMALGSAGQLKRSRDALHRVLEVLGPDSSPLLARAIAFAAFIEHLLGNHDEAQELLLSWLARVPDQASAGAAEIKNELAIGSFFNADWEGMRYWARDVLRTDPDDSLLRAAASGELALAEYGAGAAARADQLVEDARRAIDGLPDGTLAGRLEALCWLGWAEYCTGAIDHAARHMQRGVAISRDTGQEHLIVAMLVVEAMGLLAQGRLDEATDLAEAAIDSSLLSSNHLFLTWALTVRCMAEIAVGDLDAARRFGEEAVSAGAKSRSPWSAVADTYLAEALLESDQADRARRQLLGSKGTPNLPPFPLYKARCYEILTRAELQLGRPEAAAKWADHAMSAAEETGLEAQIAEALRARAALLLSRGEAEAAAGAAGESVSAAETAGLPLEAVRSRLLAAEALVAAGQTAEARGELQASLTDSLRCGAFRFRDQAVSRLDRMDRPLVESDGGSAVGRLSARERQVAELVTSGKTNREIAVTLALSEKTVEGYLSRIFNKLGAANRAEVAARFERARGTASPAGPASDG